MDKEYIAYVELELKTKAKGVQVMARCVAMYVDKLGVCLDGGLKRHDAGDIEIPKLLVIQSDPFQVPYRTRKTTSIIHIQQRASFKTQRRCNDQGNSIVADGT